MVSIINKKELAPKIKTIELQAPDVAGEVKPGHFVILRIDEKGERFPLSIAGVKPVDGTVQIIFAEVGKSTQRLGKIEEGGGILDLVGPLGNPTEIDRFGSVLCVGSGVMSGPLLYTASSLRKAGNQITGVLGARNKETLILEKEMNTVCDELYVTTDDGSAGETGIGFLNQLLDEKQFDRAIVMGPVITMKTVSEMTRRLGIKTLVTLTPIMVDGTGMCGCCRVSVSDKIRYACIDGPEFDGHDVDWDQLISRKYIFLPEERMSSLLFERQEGIQS